MMKTIVKKCEDFKVTGDGQSEWWLKTDWHDLICMDGENEYDSRYKVLYSNLGIYFLFDCKDELLTCSIQEDMKSIFLEDVVEVFLHPEGSAVNGQALYFEYELSPLDKELVLLIPNKNNDFHGWQPWEYEGDRLVEHSTRIVDGDKSPMATCKGWRAEFFIPFTLFAGLIDEAPTSGSKWKANAYRIDYDSGTPKHWAWNYASGKNFHNYEKFGVFEFE